MKTVLNVYSGTTQVGVNNSGHVFTNGTTQNNSTALGGTTEYIVTVFNAPSQSIEDAPIDSFKYLRGNGVWFKHSDVAYLQDTPPDNPMDGDIWFNTTTKQIQIFENNQWHDIKVYGLTSDDIDNFTLDVQSIINSTSIGDLLDVNLASASNGKVLTYSNGDIILQSPEAIEIEINPVITYTNGIVTRIDFDSGNYKLLTYTDGLLTRVDYHKGAQVLRKDLVYVDGRLSQIIDTVV